MKYFCFFWCKNDQNPFRNDFTIFVWKNVVLYEIYSVKSRVKNTYVHGLYMISAFISNYVICYPRPIIFVTFLICCFQAYCREYTDSWNVTHLALSINLLILQSLGTHLYRSVWQQTPRFSIWHNTGILNPKYYLFIYYYHVLFSMFNLKK